MRLTRLRVRNFRGIAEAELDLHPRLNVFVGANGAGKTSVLEAMHLLSYGRSFRRGPRANLIQRGAASLSVYAEVARGLGGHDRLGLALGEAGAMDIHINGAAEQRLGELLRRCAVCCLEPGSHELIAGAAELRRAYLDWALFHVEPGFWDTWRRFQRALQQRNALLRQAGTLGELAPWDRELVQHGVQIAKWRAGFTRGALEPELQRCLAVLLPELGASALVLDPGWSGGETEEGYAQALSARVARDRERRQTGVGPHRADWRVRFEHAPLREHLSRGQEKLLALACTLAQVAVLRRQTGEWPIVCFDDLPSELDLAHARYALGLLLSGEAQTMVTGTHFDPALRDWMQDAGMFHVEQGSFQPGPSASG